jgi:anti-sigma factor RsiW
MDPSAEHGGHRQFEDMAVAHVLGGLDETSGRVFRAHLVDCSDCRARVGELRSIAHDLAGVEQAERRVRAARAVEMKSRETDAGPSGPPRSTWRSRWGPRLLFFGVLLAVLGLAAYTFALRSHVANLQVGLEEQRHASAALEFGETLRLEYVAPGVSATAKVHGERLVVLVDGVGEAVHGLYLLQGAGADAHTLRREPMRPTDGRLFFLTELRGDEDRLVVTQPAESGLTVDPGSVGSSKVLEAVIPARTP